MTASVTRVPNEVGWEDLRFPMSGFNPAGSTAPATVDTNTGLLSFSGSADNIVGGIAQMPHAWRAGSIIYPHIHVIIPAANAGKNSRWKFEYNRANNNAAFENNYASYTTMGTITIPSTTSHYCWLDPEGWGALDMSGYRESSMIMWRITRLAASDVADDDTNALILAEFDIHYQVEKRGTRTPTPGA